MKSLRQSILLWMAVLLVGVSVVSTLATYFYVKSEATGAVDAQLKQVAYFIANSTVTRGGPEPSVEVSNPEDLYFIEVWDPQNNLLRSSDRLASFHPPSATGFTDQNIKGQIWRSYNLVSAQNLVRVSLPADVSDEQASNAAIQVALPSAFVIPLFWLLLRIIMDRLFAPLDRATLRLHNSKSLDDEPLTQEEYPREVAPFIGAINELVSRLQASVEQQKQFVSNAAHELRTPLTAIALQISNLHKFAKSPDIKQRIFALETGSQRANHLVNRLLKLAQIDSHQKLQNLEHGNLSEIILHCVDELAPLAQQRKVTLKFIQNQKDKILVPKSEAQSIVEVLIENAILYSGKKSEVEVNLTSEKGTFQIEVKDHGIGISENKLAQVFDRFFRAAPDYAQGSGLGLTIAKATAEKLGWKITLANRTHSSGIVATVSGIIS
jgi:two-component system, OmpR family, sensor kinase